jgi:hypothetical protein
MCAELLLFSEEAGEICMNESLWPKSDPTCTLQQRARALLDQPEQVAPTVMEIIELHTWMEDEWRANNDGEDLPMVDYARAVLARWGNQ